MDLKAFRLVITITFICFLTHTVYGIQDNAVGGSVRIRKTDTPIAGVEVEVPQAPDIKDTTREKDGVYVLSIPKSLKRFDLVYKHPSFLRQTSEGIPNEQTQNKRPITEMRPNSTAAVNDLSEQELEVVVAEAKKWMYRGLSENLPMLVETGAANLYSLMKVGQELNDEARQNLRAGDSALAEAKYVKSIKIQEKVNPHSEQVVQTLEDYAALLRATNRKAKADEQMAKAAKVRSNAIEAREYWALRQRSTRDEMAAFIYSRDLNYFEFSRIMENTAKTEAAEKFALKNASKLPNLEQTVVPLSGTEQHYGRLLIPSGKSGTFKVYVYEGNVPSLKVLNSSRLEFDIKVSDEKGVPVGKTAEEIVFWETTQTGTYTITLSNKTSRSIEYVLSLSANRFLYRLPMTAK